MSKKNLMGLIMKETTRLPFNLFHKSFSGTFLTDIEIKVKDLKQILKMLPEGRWVLIKKYTKRKSKNF